MNIESLYPLVDEKIRRAEILAQMHAPGAQNAFRDVSLIEEQIAQLLPPTDTEGVIARRGAVRAALAANDFRRAEELTTRFTTEKDAEQSLKQQLIELLKEAQQEVSREIPARPGQVETCKHVLVPFI